MLFCELGNHHTWMQHIYRAHDGTKSEKCIVLSLLSLSPTETLCDFQGYIYFIGCFEPYTYAPKISINTGERICQWYYTRRMQMSKCPPHQSWWGKKGQTILWIIRHFVLVIDLSSGKNVFCIVQFFQNIYPIPLFSHSDHLKFCFGCS